MFKKFLCYFILFLVFVFSVSAETNAIITEDNEASISDNGLGVELRFDRSGNLLSLKSTYYHPVEFPDKRGISKAYIIAEEKAKANIARFQNQIVTTNRVVEEIDSSQSNSSRNRSNNGELWSKDNTRKVTESLREMTTSSATSLLRGVRIIAQSYDPKTEEVMVVVGISRQSKQSASQLNSELSPGDKSRSGQSNGSFPGSPSEKKQSKDAADF